MTEELAMFPLGSTAFPQQIVPLHVFEPRYRQMMTDLLVDPSNPGAFGIALIERGFEVGGGDQRSPVATRMAIAEAQELDDGRWAVVAAGVERVTVLEWLDDDPYPRARVEARPVRDDGGSNLDAIEESVAEVMQLMAEIAGVPPRAPLQYSGDAQTRLDELSAVAPLNDFDRYQVLAAETTSEQSRLLEVALEDKLAILRAQLGPGKYLG